MVISKKNAKLKPLKRAFMYGIGTGIFLVYFFADFPVGIIPIVYERY